MKKMTTLITRFPLVTFMVVLAAILAIILIGGHMRAPDVDTTSQDTHVKTVVLFDHADMLFAIVSAEVDRADTIILRATASGIVTRALPDGTDVARGREIVKLSDTYSGATNVDAAVALAQRSVTYQNVIAGTQDDLFKAQDKNINKADDRNAKIARKQVYLSERAAEFARDNAQLQASQAVIAAAAYRTVAPLAGRVEEVRVRVGDTVNRGDIVAVLHVEQEQDIYFVAYVGSERAAHVDVSAQTVALIDDVEVPVELVHIADSSGQGQAYALTYRTQKERIQHISDGSFITLRVPLTSDDDILVPLDSVRFGSTTAEIYLYEEGIARARTITLGDVVGSYVIVTEGLQRTDRVILDRTVTEGVAVQEA